MKLTENIGFLTSSFSFDTLPEDYGAEVAFAGRSNSGKSSVLNTLTGRKSLAKTSSVPGKTRCINLFVLNKKGDQRLADLPGYGYAKVSVREQERWGKELTRYIAQRSCLRGVVIVMDMRHPLTELDRQMLTLCQISSKPVHVLLNKSDKLKQTQKASTKNKVEKDLASLAPGASVGTFSAAKREGVTELRALVKRWLNVT